MTLRDETVDLLRDLAKRPANHDKVKSSFFELLVREFGLDRSALDFEVRAPVIAGRLDALVGRLRASHHGFICFTFVLAERA